MFNLHYAKLFSASQAASCHVRYPQAGNAVGTADPECPKGCSILCAVMLSKNTSEHLARVWQPLLKAGLSVWQPLVGNCNFISCFPDSFIVLVFFFIFCPVQLHLSQPTVLLLIQFPPLSHHEVVNEWPWGFQLPVGLNHSMYMWNYTMNAARSALSSQRETQLPLSSALYLHVLCGHKLYRLFHRSDRGNLSAFKLPAISLSQVLYQIKTLTLKPNQKKLKNTTPNSKENKCQSCGKNAVVELYDQMNLYIYLFYYLRKVVFFQVHPTCAFELTYFH